MRDAVIHIVHPDVERISDRSARQVLKTLSTSVRQALSDDLYSFIYELDLPYSRRQSLWDQMDGPVQRTPAYDLEELRKGSLILIATVSVAVVGVFIKEVIDTLEEDEDRKVVLTALKQHLKVTWPKSILERTVQDLKDRGLGARMIVTRHEMKIDEKRATADIEAATEEDEDGLPVPRDETLTSATIVSLIDQKVEEIDSR